MQASTTTDKMLAPTIITLVQGRICYQHSRTKMNSWYGTYNEHHVSTEISNVKEIIACYYSYCTFCVCVCVCIQQIIHLDLFLSLFLSRRWWRFEKINIHTIPCKMDDSPHGHCIDNKVTRHSEHSKILFDHFLPDTRPVTIGIHST